MDTRDAKSEQKVSKVQRYSRTDYRYWQSRIFQPKESANYVIQLQAHKERRKISLELSEKRKAAKEAARLYGLVKINGWEKGLKLFRGEQISKKTEATLGEWLEEVRATGHFEETTFKTHSTKIRTLASELPTARISQSIRAKKNDYVNGGNKNWSEAVEKISLSAFTSETIKKWQRDRRKGSLKIDSTNRTANSIIRSGKALFKPALVEELADLFDLPDPLPFRAFKIKEPRVKRYTSEIEFKTLFIAAQRELSDTSPEMELDARMSEMFAKIEKPWPAPSARDIEISEQQAHKKNQAFRVLVLALTAGLRRGEIDKLTWKQVDFEQSRIQIEETYHFCPKTEQSARIVGVGPNEMAIIKSWLKDSQSEFVVEGRTPTAKKSPNYRASVAQEELISWLRAKGVTARMALHSLRKEYGSIICEQAGIHAASALLGHSNVSVTDRHYIENRRTETVDLGLGL